MATDAITIFNMACGEKYTKLMLKQRCDMMRVKCIMLLYRYYTAKIGHDGNLIGY